MRDENQSGAPEEAAEGKALSAGMVPSPFEALKPPSISQARQQQTLMCEIK